MPHIMSREAALKLIELARNPYRPPQILELKKKIETETRVAELKASATGHIDEEVVQRIVEMKLELDNLSALWAEGNLT